MELNIESLKNEDLRNCVEKLLDDDEIRKDLEKALEKAEEGVKLSIENKEILVQEAKSVSKKGNVEDSKYNINFNITTKDDSKTKLEDNINSKVKNKDNIVVKVIKSGIKITGEFLDNALKVFLKKNFKIKYSTYNTWKNAIKSAFKKDIPNFLKKGTDMLMSPFKEIPSSIKKIIKDTKDVAIDEIASWKK